MKQAEVISYGKLIFKVVSIEFYNPPPLPQQKCYLVGFRRGLHINPSRKGNNFMYGS